MIRLVQTRGGLAHGDFYAFVEQHLAIDSLTTDVGAVETTEVTENELVAAKFDHAVLFGNDLVQELDRVVGVSAKRVLGPQLNGALTVRS